MSASIPNQTIDNAVNVYGTNTSMNSSMQSGFGLTPKRLQDNIIRAAAYTDKKGQLKSPNIRTAPFGQRNHTQEKNPTAAGTLSREPPSTGYSGLGTVQPSELSMNQGSVNHPRDVRH